LTCAGFLPTSGSSAAVAPVSGPATMTFCGVQVTTPAPFVQPSDHLAPSLWPQAARPRAPPAEHGGHRAGGAPCPASTTRWPSFGNPTVAASAGRAHGPDAQRAGLSLGSPAEGRHSPQPLALVVLNRFTSSACEPTSGSASVFNRFPASCLRRSTSPPTRPSHGAATSFQRQRPRAGLGGLGRALRTGRVSPARNRRPIVGQPIRAGSSVPVTAWGATVAATKLRGFSPSKPPSITWALAVRRFHAPRSDRF